MDNFNFETTKDEIFDLINNCRSNPSIILPELQKRESSFEGNSYMATEMKVESTEGVKAVSSCIQHMINSKNLKKLEYSTGLEDAAKELAEYLGQEGLISHRSQDGATLDDRVSKLGRWRSKLGELVAV